MTVLGTLRWQKGKRKQVSPCHREKGKGDDLEKTWREGGNPFPVEVGNQFGEN